MGPCAGKCLDELPRSQDFPAVDPFLELAPVLVGDRAASMRNGTLSETSAMNAKRRP